LRSGSAVAHARPQLRRHSWPGRNPHVISRSACDWRWDRSSRRTRDRRHRLGGWAGRARSAPSDADDKKRRRRPALDLPAAARTRAELQAGPIPRRSRDQDRQLRHGRAAVGPPGDGPPVHVGASRRDRGCAGVAHRMSAVQAEATTEPRSRLPRQRPDELRQGRSRALRAAPSQLHRRARGNRPYTDARSVPLSSSRRGTSAST
jgi:hypothetical protein